VILVFYILSFESQEITSCCDVLFSYWLWTEYTYTIIDHMNL